MGARACGRVNNKKGGLGILLINGSVRFIFSLLRFFKIHFCLVLHDFFVSGFRFLLSVLDSVFFFFCFGFRFLLSVLGSVFFNLFWVPFSFSVPGFFFFLCSRFLFLSLFRVSSSLSVPGFYLSLRFHYLSLFRVSFYFYVTKFAFSIPGLVFFF